MKRVRDAGRSSALLFAMTLAACGGGASVTAAQRGDLPTLRARITAGERSRELHLAEVAEIARATAAHEIAVATGDTLIERIHDVRACAPELDHVLSSRMKKEDAAGGEAAMALYDAGRLGDGEARSYLHSTDDHWRAVGVRGLTRSRDAAERKKALSDPSPLVRRAALRAMEDDLDAADLDVVFEAARTDPEPIVRTDAVRLMGRLAPADRDAPDLPAEIARRLRDLYPTADDPLREDIAQAWAEPEVFAHGGREAIRVLLASEQGAGALSAAAAVLREPRVVDEEIEAAARSTLVRAVESGARRHRLHAIAIAPLSALSPSARGAKTLSPLLEAMEKATHDDDPEVEVSALGRLASSSAPAAGQKDAIHRLEVIAATGKDPEISPRARALLGSAGDIRAQAWLENDLLASEAWQRLSAVGALVNLGRATRAAPILGDADPSVRTRGACALLVAARVGPGVGG
jgi:hypothetical protein